MNPELLSLLNSLPDGVVVVDRSGTILFFNSHIERMFGYRSHELVGANVDSLLPESLRALHHHHREKFHDAPTTRSMGSGLDLVACRKDGSLFPVEIGLSVMQAAEGVHVIAIVTDISRRKHAEQRSQMQRDVALVLSEATSLEESIPKLLDIVGRSLAWKLGILWLIDENGMLRCAGFWSEEQWFAAPFERTSRRQVFAPGEGLPGRALASGQPGWASDLMTDAGFTRRLEAQDAGLQTAFEFPIVVEKESVGVLEFYSTELRRPDDSTTEILAAVGRQIGQFVRRKRSEEALQQSERRYRSLVENAVFGIFRSTVDGQLLDTNMAMAAMLEYRSPVELMLLNLDQDIYVDEAARRKIIKLANESESFEGAEVAWKTRSGGIIEVRLSGRAIRRPTGELVGFDAIAENVTQRKLLEQQFLQSQKMEALGQLAGGVAHDFNNLLTVISVYSDVVMEHVTHHEMLSQSVREIHRATEQGAGLIRQLMAFSRRQPQRVEVVDLARLAHGMERMLRVLAGESIELEIRAEGKPTVSIDPNQAEQIFLNLVSNARDAMPGGGTVTIQATVVNAGELPQAWNQTGKFAKLSVGDTGEGIPRDIQQHIFEPFFTTKEQGKGTGLGLATVYGIIRQHGGEILCDSVVGEGTTFSIFLPVVAEPTPAEPAVYAGDTAPSGTETILLVEDETPLRNSIRSILVRMGYTVVDASNGAEGLQIALNHKGKIHLLITDIALPEMRGGELARRALERQPEMKVLFMSGYDSADLSPAVRASFIPKPFNREKLTRKIREVLES